jgi:hypothetical protein
MVLNPYILKTLSIIFLTSFFVGLSGQSLEKSVRKEALKYYQQDIELKVHEIELADIDGMYDSDVFYLIRDTIENKILGYCFATSAKGRYENFDYFIIYNPDLHIASVKVWLYRSSHGGAIANKRWLQQFADYNGQELTYGKDIQAVSGATLSGKSIVSDIQRVQKIIVELRYKQVI